MDLRATACYLGAAHSAQQSNRLDTFFLIYGLEAILLADIMWKSPRIETYQEGEADKARQVELDSTEEIRCNANQQDIFKESDATMIATSSKAHSMLETWYCGVLRTK